MHPNLKAAQIRLDRAILNFDVLNQQGISAERLAIALSRLVIFTNTMASHINSADRDPEARNLNDCADLLWSLGEKLRAINPQWFGLDEAR